MRNLLFIPVLLFSFSKLDAQKVSKNDKKQIVKRLEENLEQINNANWEIALEYSYPKKFTVLPKSVMINSFKKLDDFGIKNLAEDLKISYFEDLGTIAGERYVAIKYSNYVTTTYPEDKVSILSSQKEQLKEKFGEENVTIDIGSNSIRVFVEKTSMAIYLDEQENWFFIDYTESQMGVLTKIIPEEILNKISKI